MDIGCRYQLRAATMDDYDFLYNLLVATMKRYVEQTWGWNELYQQRRFREKFHPKDYKIIVVEDRDVGVISTERWRSELFLAEIQICPEYQRRGIATSILRDLMRKAEQQQIPLTLQVLRVNPARRLYERLGFVVMAENETHAQMQWVA